MEKESNLINQLEQVEKDILKIEALIEKKQKEIKELEFTLRKSLYPLGEQLHTEIHELNLNQ